MNLVSDVFDTVLYKIGHDVGSIAEILAMLLMVLIFALYEFLVYRVVSHRNMYNKSFHISIMIIPFFIGAIIMALQSSVVITLGTVGALAIIRFRTAIKDPVDMIYILWSIFVGITCGCQLYELCALTSLMVTLVLLLTNFLESHGAPLFKNPYILVINCSKDIEKDLKSIIDEFSIHHRLKSRNYTSNGYDYVFQIQVKNPIFIIEKIQETKFVEQYSLLEYDNEDVI